MARYAFLHEMWMVLRSIEEEKKALELDLPFIFLNGSWREDIWCHSRALYHFKSGALNLDEWEVLSQLGELLRSMFPLPLMVVYLSCKPSILLRRTYRHGSSSEKAITLNYLDTLSAYHGELIAYMREETVVIRIPVDKADFYTDAVALEDAARHIVTKLQQLCVHV